MNQQHNRIWSIANQLRASVPFDGGKELVLLSLFISYLKKLGTSSEKDLIVKEITRQSNLKGLLYGITTVVTESHLLRPNIPGSLWLYDYYREFDQKSDERIFQSLIELVLMEPEGGIREYEVLFGFILEKFSLSAGKSGMAITPNSIGMLFKALVPNAKSVKDYTFGSGHLSLHFLDDSEVKVYGQDYDEESLFLLGGLQFAFRDNVQLTAGDSLLDPQFIGLEADAIIIDPPINVRIDQYDLKLLQETGRFWLPNQKILNANFLWLQLASSSTKNKGIGLVLMSNNTLVSAGEDQEMREWLIEQGKVLAIISLPGKMLFNTVVSTSIWVFAEQNERNEILLIDASNYGNAIVRGVTEFSKSDIKEISGFFNTWNNDWQGFKADPTIVRAVPIQEIRENDYLLAPQRYLESEHLNENVLESGVEIGTLLKSVSPFPVVGKKEAKKLSVRDLLSSPDNFTIDSNALDDARAEQKAVFINRDVILLARIGEQLKPSFLAYNQNLSYYIQNVYLFELISPNSVSIEYLVQELNKEYVVAQVKQRVAGGTIPSLKRSDLESIKILLPSLEEQHRLVEEERSIRFQTLAKLNGLEAEIDKIKEEQRKLLGSKRHNILQHLSNVKSSIEIIDFLLKKNGRLDANDVIERKTGTTVVERIARLEESLVRAVFYVKNLTNELRFGKPAEHNVIELINLLKQRGIQSELIDVQIIPDDESFDDEEPIIDIAETDLEEIYNNLLGNAVRHGFVDNGRKYTFRITISRNGDNLELLFENNGIPFLKGMAEVYTIKGEKAGKTGNDGFGGSIVAEMTEHNRGKLEVIDEPDAEFPVAVKLTFKWIYKSEDEV